MFDRLRFSLELRKFVPNAFTTLGLAAIILGSSQTIGEEGRFLLFATLVGVWAWIVIEFIFRIGSAGAASTLRTYLTSIGGLIDLAAVTALPLGWLVTPSAVDAPLFAMVWTLRYVRHSHNSGVLLLWRTMRRSRTALLSVGAMFLVVFLLSATLAYVFERQAQPEAFGSVPRAMWWAIVTLTTTGYGDLVPVTVWGRLLAGWVMIGGIVMFALQAGIIAGAFAEELQRRHFLHTWNLVTTVPFFQELGAAAIADIVRLLQVRDVAKGTLVLRQGDAGDAMYFVVSGAVAVQRQGEPIILGRGGFFGEMALLFGAPRSASVIAAEPSVLLVLDIADFRVLAGRRPELVDAIEAEGKRRREANVTLAQSSG